MKTYPVANLGQWGEFAYIPPTMPPLRPTPPLRPEEEYYRLLLQTGASREDIRRTAVPRPLPPRPAVITPSGGSGDRRFFQDEPPVRPPMPSFIDEPLLPSGRQGYSFPMPPPEEAAYFEFGGAAQPYDVRGLFGANRGPWLGQVPLIIGPSSSGAHRSADR